MSFAHHANPEEQKVKQDVIRRLMDQLEDKAKREYPEGRIGANDEGTLAFVIKADLEHGVVTVHFGKPVSWFGMSPQDVMKFVDKLVAAARQISTEPLTMSLGG